MPKSKKSEKPNAKGKAAKEAAKSSKKPEKVPKIVKPRGQSVKPQEKESEETAVMKAPEGRASRYESAPAKFSAEYAASRNREIHQ